MPDTRCWFLDSGLRPGVSIQYPASSDQKPESSNQQPAEGGDPAVRDKRPITVEKVDNWRWRLPREGKMRTDGMVYATDTIMTEVRKDESLRQVANVSWLPGIVGCSLAMPDIHWGYGFPIGGVAAFSLDEGVVSPGGVGYDIN
jgi:hypothetical protein